MKPLIAASLIALLPYPPGAQAEAGETIIYINKNLGFNVPGFNYAQAEFPCDLDTKLVEALAKRGKRHGLNMEIVGSAEKIRNGSIPVLAMDIEQLVLNKDTKFGARTYSDLPSVGLNAAIILGDKISTKKHACAIGTLKEFTPSSNVLDLGTTATVCSATEKCLKNLSKDIVRWVKAQVQ